MDAFTGSFRRHKFGLHVLFVSVGMVQIAVGFTDSDKKDSHCFRRFLLVLPCLTKRQLKARI